MERWSRSGVSSPCAVIDVSGGGTGRGGFRLSSSPRESAACHRLAALVEEFTADSSGRGDSALGGWRVEKGDGEVWLELLHGDTGEVALANSVLRRAVERYALLHG